MKHLKRWLLIALCAPWDLGALSIAVVVSVLPGWTLTLGDRWIVWLEMPEGLTSRMWPYSTTLGHVVLMHPHATAQTYVHEAEHVRQFEGWCCAAWIAFAIAYWSPYYAIAVAPWSIYFGASVAAFLRGDHWYEANTFERGARGAAGQAVR